MHGAGDGHGAAALEHAVPQPGGWAGSRVKPSWAACHAHHIPRACNCCVAAIKGGATPAAQCSLHVGFRACPMAAPAGGGHVPHCLLKGPAGDPAAPLSRVQGLSVPLLQPGLEGAAAGLYAAAPPLPGRRACALAQWGPLPQRRAPGAGGPAGQALQGPAGSGSRCPACLSCMCPPPLCCPCRLHFDHPARVAVPPCRPGGRLAPLVCLLQRAPS